MAKKIILVVGVLLVLASGVFFISMRRSHMMGGGMGYSNQPAGGLHAVSAQGETLPVPAALAAELAANSAAQESGGMLVTLAINPYPPTGSKMTDFEVTLMASDGQPISDATISLDMTMPEMRMPANNFDLEPLAAGQYRGSGFFTMRGWWRIEVLIARGAEKQSVFFDVDL